MASHKILLIEDHPDDVELAVHGCKASRVASDVVVVGSGGEALEYLFATGRHAGRDQHDLPALVILDIGLPDMGGLEVLRTMRGHKETRRIPVVVLTNSDSDADVIGSYDLGANSYIRKPVEFDVFTNIMVQLKQYWLVTNTAPPMG